MKGTHKGKLHPPTGKKRAAKEVRRIQAEVRNAAYAAMTPAEKLAYVLTLPGECRRQRSRLEAKNVD